MRVDKAKSYNYVTRAISNVREKNVRDQKVFKVRDVVGHLSSKVLLAVSKMIKVASFAFLWEMMEKHTHNQIRCGKAWFSVAENHAIQGAELDDLGSRAVRPPGQPQRLKLLGFSQWKRT